MCAPKCPGSEVREEYKGFWCANNRVHPEIIQTEKVLNKQKRAVATGGHKAGVLNSSILPK
jgi:ketol-acid reductoisomerase